MIDSGASTNVMPLTVMKRLGLKTTRPYKNVCAIDSREIIVLGLTKDLNVNLAVYPNISALMHIVVIDVPESWCVLISKKCVASLGGNTPKNNSWS